MISEGGARDGAPLPVACNISFAVFTWITSLISILLMPPADKQDGVKKKERVKKMGQQAGAR
jgi:hypothetical protein